MFIALNVCLPWCTNFPHIFRCRLGFMNGNGWWHSSKEHPILANNSCNLNIPLLVPTSATLLKWNSSKPCFIQGWMTEKKETRVFLQQDRPILGETNLCRIPPISLISTKETFHIKSIFNTEIRIVKSQMDISVLDAHTRQPQQIALFAKPRLGWCQKGHVSWSWHAIKTPSRIIQV
jgi:hypothetical protein